MSVTESAALENRYGAKRIRKGFLHFLLGKLLTSVAGIGTMLLLVRELPLEDFAKYSILFGLVELISTISGMGLIHILSRYIPEAHGNHLDSVTRRLIIGLTGLRFAILAIVLVALYVNSEFLSAWIGLDGWQWALQAYLLVVLVRTCATTFFSVLESLLQQGIAQLGFSTVTLVRFVALISFALSDHGLDLATVIWVEVLTDLLGLAIMGGGLLRVMPRAGHGQADTGNWVSTNFRRMSQFGAKGYAQHLLLAPFGASSDRLLVGARLATGQVAVFGFAQQILDLMERYLPAQMFVGLIRPVLTARFAAGKGFAELQIACNAFLKLNLFLIAGFAVTIFAGGTSFLDAVTGGKKFDQLVPLILMMCLLASLYSWRHILDLVTHTVERNGPLIVAHAIMNLSVLPGVLLMPYWGVFALPWSHVLGVSVGCTALLAGLARAGYQFRHDLRGIGLLALAMIAAMLFSWLVPPYWHWAMRITVCGLAYVGFVLVLQPLTSVERTMIAGMFSKRGGQGAGDPGANAAAISGST